MISKRFVTDVTLVTCNGVLELGNNNNNTLYTLKKAVTPVTPVTIDRCKGCGVWLFDGTTRRYCEYCQNE